MPDATELLYSNLHEVFSERDPGKRWTAIERTYLEDVRFIDPQGEVVGRQALNDRKVIERTKGIMMKKTGLDEADAFRRLQKLASEKNRKLVDIAGMILTAEEAFQSPPLLP